MQNFKFINFDGSSPIFCQLENIIVYAKTLSIKTYLEGYLDYILLFSFILLLLGYKIL